MLRKISASILTTTLHTGRARSLEEAPNVLLYLVRGAISIATRGLGWGWVFILLLLQEAFLNYRLCGGVPALGFPHTSPVYPGGGSVSSRDL